MSKLCFLQTHYLALLFALAHSFHHSAVPLPLGGRLGLHPPEADRSGAKHRMASLRLKPKKRGCRKRQPQGGMLAVAAATEDENQSQDDDPGAVVVEEMAKTVVHRGPFCHGGRAARAAFFEGVTLHITILCGKGLLVTVFILSSLMQIIIYIKRELPFRRSGGT